MPGYVVETFPTSWRAA